MNNVDTALKNGTVLYTKIQHVSASGMSREIAVYAVEDGRIVNMTSSLAFALDLPYGKHAGILMKGCGLDLGFVLVSAASDKFGLKLKHAWLE